MPDQVPKSYIEHQTAYPEAVDWNDPRHAHKQTAAYGGFFADKPSNGGEEPKRRILGLKPMIFVAIAALAAMIVVVVIVVPAVVVTSNKNNSKQVNDIAATASLASARATTTLSTGSRSPTTLQTVTTPSRSSSASTTSPTTSPTAITILSANYGGTDVTDAAKQDFTNGSSITINTNSMPLTDPWVNVKKCLSILHSFGSSIRTFVACEGDGQLTLAPGKASNSPKTSEITRQGPTSSNFAIVSVVWGSQEITSQSVYQMIFNAHQGSERMTLSNDFFGGDTLVNWQKSAVIWYTLDNFNTIKSIYGREGDAVSF